MICRLTVRFSWWVQPYIHALKTFAFITGMEPDEDKAVATCMRGMRMEIRPSDH